ncbi:MAG: amino acid adenylation domain-containing protein, partial [bacterium]|nr:amino acid adenylation domain-containing protein [bacterium]
MRPFDLSRAPLLRAALIKTRENSILQLDMHHIISDGVSHKVLKEEFLEIYKGKTLPALRLQYKDYAVWRNKPEQREEIKQQEAYWLEALQGELPVLNLPTDYARPNTQRFDGHSLRFFLNPGETECIKRTAHEADSTLFMVVLAAFNVLLSRLSGQEDIIIGVPIAARRHADLDRIIGIFVNTLVLRQFPCGEKTFGDFLGDVKERTLDAFENQEYQFEDLVERLAVRRDAGRNPVFDVMFNLLNQTDYKDEAANTEDKIENKITYGEPGLSKFDISLNCFELGPHLILQLDYCTKLFKVETMTRFAGYLKRILLSVPAEPRQKLVFMEMMSQEEREQLLYRYNDTAVDFPPRTTLHQWFEANVGKTPHNTAAVFKGNHVTYSLLNARAGAVAGHLREAGIRPRRIVGIITDRSMETIAGILGILKAGCAYLPISPDFPLKRIQYVLADSALEYLLVDLDEEAYGNMRGQLPSNVHSLNLKHSNLYLSRGNSPYREDTPGGATDAAYIIYTSGSTGNPKGVVIEHRSAVNDISWFARKYITANETCRNILQLSDFIFDASVDQVFAPLLHGAVLYVAHKELLIHMDELREFIRQKKIHLINFVPTLLRELFGGEESLGALKVVISGGEQLDAPLKEKVLARGYALYNHYGPTETTINALASKCSAGSRVTLGKPPANHQVYILGKNGELCPHGVPGELCVSGIGVARGYLNRPGLTAEKFPEIDGTCFAAEPRIHRRPPGAHVKRLYHSGDQVKYLEDGDIEFLGRMDKQVKIRGLRIELGEIEHRLLEIPGIKEAAVLPREHQNGDRYLYAYIVKTPLPEQARANSTETAGTGSDDFAGIKKALANHLPAYMVPSFFVPLVEMPLAHNGKIDRNALPEPGARAGEDYIAPTNEVESKLVDIWSEVLNIDKESIGTGSNFFDLGGHSLKAAVLISRIHKIFNVNIPLMDIFKTPVISSLSKHITNSRREMYAGIEPAETREYYPPSSAQKRLYILQEMTPGNTAYNMFNTIVPAEAFDKDRLQKTFKRLIARHESLRTSFQIVNEEPVQRIHKQVEFEIEYVEAVDNHRPTAGKEDESTANGERPSRPVVTSPSDGRHLPATTPVGHFIRPFDLNKAPLLRVGLLSPGNNILLVDMHHIISDGLSQRILEEEFGRLYNEDHQSTELRLQYKDYTQWLNNSLRREKIEKQETYWLNEFSENVPLLELPTDFSRPHTRSFEGETILFNLNERETHIIKRKAKETGTTLYMVVLSLFNILLAKLSGREDIVTGTPVAARRHADLERIIGMFVNTIALRNFPAGNKTFQGFLNEVKQNSLKAFDNQEYPFEELVDKVTVQRSINRNPLFDVMFNFLTAGEAPGHRVKLNRKTMDRDAGGDSKAVTPNVGLKQIVPTPGKTSTFDMTLSGMEQDETLAFTLQYCTKLFKPETVERFISYFRKIIIEVETPVAGKAADAGNVVEKKISDIEIISNEERTRLLYEFNNTQTDYPSDKTLHELFEARAQKTPHHIALAGPDLNPDNKGSNDDMYLTYRELDYNAHRLALRLKDKGVGSTCIVGIILHRSLDHIIGLLAILKADAAYLPLEPDYPTQRKIDILKDANVRIIISLEKYSGGLDDFNVIDLNRGCRNHAISRPPSTSGDTQPQSTHCSHNPAYVIYTSGTSGRPKGVVVEHHSIVNYALFRIREFAYTRDDVCLQMISVSFDAFGSNLYPALLSGGKIVLLKDVRHLEHDHVNRLIKKEKVTHFSLVPRVYELLLETATIGQLAGLRFVVLGGEKTEDHLAALSKKLYPELEIINEYGPTECTVAVAVYRDMRPGKTTVIGSPVSNTRIYILDKRNRLQPVGVVGELCIAGAGLARGYLNRIQLTKEKFVQNPFAPGEKIYKSGDQARRLADGNIEFLGRLDKQVKIRGFRIETGEIESRLAKHSQILESIVMNRPDEQGRKYLCAYIVGTSGPGHFPGHNELCEYLSLYLPDYMIPGAFVKLDKIPLKPGGKVDTNALPAPDITVAEECHTPPVNENERKLVDIWAEVLTLNKTVVGTQSNFFRLGGHSLKATLLTTKIFKEFNVNLPLIEVFKNPTISGLSKMLAKSQKETYVLIEPAEKREYYALSSAQKRLFITQQIDPDSTAYNLPQTLWLEGELNKEKLEGAFIEIISRHESFRTSFRVVKNEAFQVIHSPGEVPFSLHYYKADEVEAHQLVTQFVRPFRLDQSPLIRAGLVEIHHGKYILMMDSHHIIMDGTSHGLLVNQLMSLYVGDTLPPLELQYKDFSQWKNSADEVIEIKKQEKYWKKQFQVAPPLLELPGDYPRPPVKSSRGGKLVFEIPPHHAREIKEWALDENVTLYMMLLSLYFVLLWKLTGQEDIVVGTGTKGRNHPELEPVIGMFVNTLPIRNFPQRDIYFKDFLTEVKKSTLNAFDNQDYQFEDLVEQVVKTRRSDRNPLFEAGFIVQNLEEAREVELAEFKLSPYAYDSETTKLDMSLVARETENTLEFSIQYSTKIFKQETIERFIDYFKKILSSVLENKNKVFKLKDINVSL